MLTECGPAQPGEEQSVATESDYEDMKDNKELCQVLESVELCYGIALSLVEQIRKYATLSHTQQKSETGRAQESKKRKLYDGLSSQPSMQQRRRRKKEKNEGHTENKSKWENQFNFQFSKTNKVNTPSIKGISKKTLPGRGKTKVRNKSQISAQKKNKNK